MSKTFMLKILTTSSEVVSEEVQNLTIKTDAGFIQILPNHEEMIISTVAAVTRFVDASGDKKELFTAKGIVNIKKEATYFCLDAAEFPEEIDLERAESAKKRAQEKLKEGNKLEVEIAKACLERANLRIGLKGHS